MTYCNQNGWKGHLRDNNEHFSSHKQFTKSFPTNTKTLQHNGAKNIQSTVNIMWPRCAGWLLLRPAWLILMTFIDNFRCANNDNEGHYWRGKTNKI